MAKSKMGSSAKGRQHANHKGKYLRQWAKTARNKKKAWALHRKNYPNDKKADLEMKKAEDKLTSYKSDK